MTGQENFPTCYVHFWHWGLLVWHATVVTLGWKFGMGKETRVSTESWLDKKIIRPLLPGIEPVTWPWVCCSTTEPSPCPQASRLNKTANMGCNSSSFPVLPSVPGGALFSVELAIWYILQIINFILTSSHVKSCLTLTYLPGAFVRNLCAVAHFIWILQLWIWLLFRLLVILIVLIQYYFYLLVI